MKPDRKSEARIILSTRIFPAFEELLQLGQADALGEKNGKGVRRNGERPSKLPACSAQGRLLRRFRVCL